MENPAHQKSTAQQATHTHTQVYLTLITFSHLWHMCIRLDFWRLLVSGRGLLNRDILLFLRPPHPPFVLPPILQYARLVVDCVALTRTGSHQGVIGGRAEVRGHGILWYQHWKEKEEKKHSYHVGGKKTRNTHALELNTCKTKAFGLHSCTDALTHQSRRCYCRPPYT